MTQLRMRYLRERARTPKRLAGAILVGALVTVGSSCSHRQAADDGAALSFEKTLQEQLILAKPGTVIDLPEGHFHVSRVLSLTGDNVTLRGKEWAKPCFHLRDRCQGQPDC